jgi:hypothetical protein
MFSDHLDAAQSKADEILAPARERGAALTVVASSALRAFIGVRRGDLVAAQADAHAAIELAPELLGAEFLVTAVSTAVLAGLERDETPDSLRGLINRTGVRFDPEFLPSAQLLYASGVLRAAAGNHEAAIGELRSCAVDHPVLGGENPGDRRRPFLWPSSAVTRRRAHWPPRRCAARGRSVRRARSASHCARARWSARRRNGRTGWRRRSRSWRPRRRGWSMLAY